MYWVAMAELALAKSSCAKSMRPFFFAAGEEKIEKGGGKSGYSWLLSHDLRMRRRL